MYSLAIVLMCVHQVSFSVLFCFNLKIKYLWIDAKKILPITKWVILPFSVYLWESLLWGLGVRGFWGPGSLLYLIAILSASLFPQTFCFLLKWPFCIAMPSLLLWTKPCPGGRLLPVLLPLCPLPLLHQRGISFALQGELLTFREHIVAEFPDMCCPELTVILPQCSPFFPHLLSSKTSALSSLSWLYISCFL